MVKASLLTCQQLSLSLLMGKCVLFTGQRGAFAGDFIFELFANQWEVHYLQTMTLSLLILNRLHFMLMLSDSLFFTIKHQFTDWTKIWLSFWTRLLKTYWLLLPIGFTVAEMALTVVYLDHSISKPNTNTVLFLLFLQFQITTQQTGYHYTYIFSGGTYNDYF